MLIDPVAIGDYPSEQELQVVRSILDAEGIEHDVTTDVPTFVVKGRGGCIRVSRGDVERARVAIAQYVDAGSDTATPSTWTEPRWRRVVLSVGGALLLMYYLAPYMLDWIRWYQQR